MNPANPFAADTGAVSRWISDRQRLLRHEAEDAFRTEILDYGPRQSEHWQRDYSSIDAYEKSIEDNRQRWAEAVGVPAQEDRAFNADLEPWFEDEGMSVWWLTVDFFGGLRARALFARPKRR